MAKKRKKRLKKSVKKTILFIFLLIIIGVGYKAYTVYTYHQSYEYKLLELNYSLDETKILLKHLRKNELDNILKRKYDRNIPQLVQEKYFLYNNLNRYLSYISKNLKADKSEVVSLINVNRDRDYYEEMTPTDTSLGTSMLCNKYHNLTSDYQAPDIVDVSTSYGYGTNKLNSDTYEAFKSLADTAKNEGYTILIVSGYRPYSRQEELWNGRKESQGIRKADAYAARPGSSEHETGYAIDVADYNDKDDKFGNTDAYKWMINNSYKFGFILRYPEKKENITGYSYEAWHFRYLGTELATKVYNENITFDEYYEYYLQK